MSKCFWNVWAFLASDSNASTSNPSSFQIKSLISSPFNYWYSVFICIPRQGAIHNLPTETKLKSWAETKSGLSIDTNNRNLVAVLITPLALSVQNFSSVSDQGNCSITLITLTKGFINVFQYELFGHYILNELAYIHNVMGFSHCYIQAHQKSIANIL
nr:hypothetical protein [Mycoplasmopsis bovis]